MKSIAFFGHRQIFNKDILKQRLVKTLEKIIPQGFSELLIGCHGDFDKLALLTSLYYRESINQDIKIRVVLTSLQCLNKTKDGYNKLDYYDRHNIETIVFDIEEVHFKNRIAYANKKMVDNSDLIIGYVEMKACYSGAKKAVNHALKQNKRVINLFEQEDKILI